MAVSIGVKPHIDANTILMQTPIWCRGLIFPPRLVAVSVGVKPHIDANTILMPTSFGTRAPTLLSSCGREHWVEATH